MSPLCVSPIYRFLYLYAKLGWSGNYLSVGTQVYLSLSGLLDVELFAGAQYQGGSTLTWRRTLEVICLNGGIGIV